MTSPLITVPELAANLEQVVILDCRFNLADTGEGERHYREGHIPGAHYCDLDQHLSSKAGAEGGRHPLPNAGDFARQLQIWGIREDVPVVVYDAQRFAYASRAWWLLRAFGYDHVRVLDGGYGAWQAAGQAVETEPARQFHAADSLPDAAFEQLPTLDYSELRQRLDKQELTIIDSRESRRFRGEEEPIDPVAGHIPGALNLPWQDITDEQGFAHPLAFHHQRWDALCGEIQPVIYCGSGVTACVNMLSAAIAGKQATLYPGSWSDWCNRPDAPVATGP
jgi:thiosulfate/3-mercaptopyruvate sulfurtransferase